MEGIDISQGKPVMQSSRSEDITHLEGVEKFEKPMQDYYNLADNISKIFAINMGLKLKIFDTIESLQERSNVKEILTALNYKTNSRHMIDFLDQLYIHNLLEREGVLENARYRNSEYTKNYLLKTSLSHYNYVFLNLDRYMKKYLMFEKNFPSGKTQLFSDELYANEEDMRCYVEYFYKSNTFNFDYLLECIDFSKYRKVCDIHGLTGCLTMKIKKKYQNIEAISFENKKIKDCAETKIKGHDMGEIVKREYGDINRDKLPEVDCIIAPHILLQYSADNKLNILKKIFDSLCNQGDLIILENLIDENRSKDDCGMKISSMFAMLGYEGFSLSFNEYKNLLMSVGFKDIQRIERKAGVSDIIIARKVVDTEKSQ